MGPKSIAPKTGDRAASTHRCAANVSPPTRNLTSAPFPPRRSSRKCSDQSGGGILTKELPAASLAASARGSLKTMMSHLTVKQSSFLRRSDCSSSMKEAVVTDEPVCLETTDVRRPLLIHLVDEAEHQLHHQVLGDGFLEDEREGDVVCSLRGVAVG